MVPAVDWGGGQKPRVKPPVKAGCVAARTVSGSLLDSGMEHMEELVCGFL